MDDKKLEEKKCGYTENEEFDEIFYDTECKNSFQTLDGTLDENAFKYCPYCGGRIQMIKEG